MGKDSIFQIPLRKRFWKSNVIDVLIVIGY